MRSYKHLWNVGIFYDATQRNIPEDENLKVMNYSNKARR